MLLFTIKSIFHILYLNPSLTQLTKPGPSSKYLRMKLITYCVLQSRRGFWKPCTAGSTQDDHMFVMPACSYLATNQRERSQCVTSLNVSLERAFRERLCVCSDRCHSSHAPDIMPLNYSTWTETHPHTLTQQECVLPGRAAAGPALKASPVRPFSLHSFRASWKNLADSSSSKYPLNRELSSTLPPSSSSTSTPSFTNNT